MESFLSIHMELRNLTKGVNILVSQVPDQNIHPQEVKIPYPTWINSWWIENLNQFIFKTDCNKSYT